MDKRGLGRGLAALITSAGSGVPDGVRELPVDQVAANPFQPRTVFDPEKLAELAASVREHGILQPVLVRQVGHERFELIAGERRFRAAQAAGLARIPAIVRDCSDRDALEMAVVENVQREDIGVMEAARAYRRLMDEFRLTQEAVSQRVGKSRPAIANTLRLLALPAEIQKSVEASDISEGHARALLMLEEDTDRLRAWKVIIAKRLSVREAESMARDPSWRRPATNRTVVRTAHPPDPNESAVVYTMQQALGTKVTLRRTGNHRGRIEIEFYTDEDLQRIADVILDNLAS